MNFDIGVGEFLVVFVVAMLSLGLPVAILFLLYKIYVRLKGIEEQLKKNPETPKREQG